MQNPTPRTLSNVLPQRLLELLPERRFPFFSVGPNMIVKRGHGNLWGPLSQGTCDLKRVRSYSASDSATKDLRSQETESHVLD